MQRNFIWLGFAALLTLLPLPGLSDGGDAERGLQVLRIAGGCTCHTNYPGEGDSAPLLAGGRALSSPFGVYYSSNITPDPETGIGNWSDADFIRAMRDGVSPEGRNYFPVFPYTAFTFMSDRDLLDLRAYLTTLEPIRRANLPPDAPFPFSWRPAITPWKWLNFETGPWQENSNRDATWNRGHYLVQAVAHCGECHTPRTLTGGLDLQNSMAGSASGPEGELAPNITSDDQTGIGRWSIPDITWFLEIGLKPDGDDTQGLMAEVIQHGYASAEPDDLRAIATYLKTVPPIHNALVVESK
ncbi:cytochrome c [Myxococcota bacterium]|nr:cytochrome c [Myxococcota bacterium]